MNHSSFTAVEYQKHGSRFRPKSLNSGHLGSFSVGDDSRLALNFGFGRSIDENTFFVDVRIWKDTEG